MSDHHPIAAEEISGRHIGEQIRFTTEDGALVQDELTEVTHFDNIVYIRLRTIVPDGVIRQQMIQFSSCFKLDPIAQIQVFA